MRYKIVLVFLSVLFCIPAAHAQMKNGQAVVQAAFDYWRGKTSTAVVNMTIHRPEWERTMTIKAWTKGEKDSLVVIISPAKDSGNSTLKKGPEMWVYNPKVNRVIKLPPSMMAQSWMGSDFSNNDLAKSDSLLHDYTHKIVGMETQEGKKVYLIESTPKPAAPVIWGKQRFKIREDYIMLTQEFYDEDGKLVKSMVAQRIEMQDGKLFPQVWVMRKADARDEFTKLVYRELTFDRDIPDGTFSLTSLKNPPR
ncbi:MAG: outer membrane lipoprotein-sorting protein [Smithellaceae bacterium]|nr:outer membrane lipoprotein-sorting protein [Smithellaceae bacterium]